MVINARTCSYCQKEGMLMIDTWWTLLYKDNDTYLCCKACYDKEEYKK